MQRLEKIVWPHEINLGASPKGCDIALASIDVDGNIGSLNSYVLKEYGYSNSDLPEKKELINGFCWFSKKKKKPILFIVTVGQRDVGESLKANLTNAILHFGKNFENRRVWIPLMGTGTGRLELEDSYQLIVRILNQDEFHFGTDNYFLISVPNEDKGKRLFDDIQNLSSSSSNINESSVLEKTFDISSEKDTNPEKNKADSETSNSNEIPPNLLLKLNEEFIGFNGNFYFVEFIWEKGNQLKSFFKRRVWELESKGGPIVNTVTNVKSGDFLFAKSNTLPKSQLNDLEIFAIGVIEDNPNDGRSLKVNWIVKNIFLRYKGETFYGDPIQPITFSDADSLLKLLRIDWHLGMAAGEVKSSSTTDSTATTTTTAKPPLIRVETIAGLISDSDTGTDYLDISNDVNAFARVMAAKSFQPPLAIALFGKWGSGKSFFMGKLKEQISFISEGDTNGIFCKGVVQIHFNAWSYMDSNLWASLVSKIFEELNFYIRDFTKTAAEKKKVEDHLKKNLSIAKEEFGILKNQQKALEQQIKNLNFRKEGIEKKLNDGIKKIKEQTIWDALNKVDDEFKSRDRIVEALKGNESFLKSQDQLKKIVPQKYWEDPERTFELIKSRSTFLKLFFRKDVFQNNLIWLGFIVLLVVAVPIFIWIFTGWLENVYFFIPQAIISFFGIFAVFGNRVEKVYKALQPLVASFWTIKESYESEINKVKSKFIQEEKGLKLEIEKSKAELIQIEGQIQNVENTKVDLEFRLNNALATEALYSFIDRRSKSEDYKKHLGLISIIRKDFEILNGLFLDHQKESGKQKSSEDFRNRFNKPLERIILYIDDLDRCPEENVVQVLEAVNLLMAFPLFVVVVGVDDRWVKNALINKHALQFKGAENGERGNDSERLEPSNYLEKIFQIPFQLKSATDSSVKNMIQNLAQSKAEISVSNTVIENPVLIPGEGEQLGGQVYEVEAETSSKQEEGYLEEGQEHISKATELPRSKSIQSEIKPEALVIESNEVELMKEMSVIIGTNPRAIKRFVNIYRVIKAHEGFDNGSISDEDELMAILFLIALPLGKLKGLSIYIEDYLYQGYKSGEKFEGYFNLGSMDTDFRRKKLDKMLNDTLERSDTLVKINQIGLKSFRKHFSFIKRFTFSNL